MAATEEEQRKIQEQAQGADTGTQEEKPAVKYEPITAKHVEAPAPDPSQSAYAQYMANYPKYDEEEEQRRLKRARSAMLLGAISDGISAMSNLYATKRYAPSAMNAKSPTLSDRAKKVYDEIEKTRQANRKAWQQGADKAAALRQKDAQNANKTKLDVEKFNAAQDLKAEQFNATLPGKEAQTNANVGKTNAQTATEEARKAEVEGRTANAANLTEERMNTEKSKQDKNDRSGGSSGGSGSRARRTLTFDKTYSFDSDVDYRRAVMKAAKKLGVNTATRQGNTKTARRIDEIAADCELEYARRHPNGAADKGTGYGTGNNGKGAGY